MAEKGESRPRRNASKKKSDDFVYEGDAIIDLTPLQKKDESSSSSSSSPPNKKSKKKKASVLGSTPSQPVVLSNNNVSIPVELDDVIELPVTPPADVAPPIANRNPTLARIDTVILAEDDDLVALGTPVAAKDKTIPFDHAEKFLEGTEAGSPSVLGIKRKRSSKKAKSSLDDDDEGETSVLAKAYKKEKPVEEKRLARFRSSCNDATYSRIERAMSQRLFLITKNAKPCTCATYSPRHTIFNVLGSTGNVYDVTICTQPKCTCPDWEKGNLCKHVLFVLLKVMKVNRHSNLVYQRAWLTSELDEMYSHCPKDVREAYANSSVREAFSALTGARLDAMEGVPSNTPTRKPYVGEDCAICYDSMGEKDNLSWCQSKDGCGNSVHTECLQNWFRASPARRCCYCRAEWVSGSSSSTPSNSKPSSSSSGFRHMEGYQNLAHLSGQSLERDDSTYYRGRFSKNGGYGGWDYGDYW